MLVNVSNVSIKYLDKTLFNNVSFVIEENDKIGIIGVNGSGKSTLIKNIVGIHEPDDGLITKKKDLKISYLPQERDFIETNNVLTEFIRYTSMPDFEAKNALSKLGVNYFFKEIKNLSGGEKKRVSIAVALATPCELLILDEPTNHLDVWMIDFLEKYLIKFNKAILLVTHDRYFLEHVTHQILDIEHSKTYLYEGNYSTYLIKKAERLVDLEAHERHLAAIYKKEAAWAKMNAQARSTKSKERLERVDILREDLNDVRSIINDNTKIDLKSFKTRMGRTTIIAENISKQIDNKVLFKDFSYILSNSDRLGVIGGNGVGKTTFIKTLLGEINPDSGTVEIGETIKIGYYDQSGLNLSKDQKVLEYLKEFGEYIHTPSGTVSASQLLEQYGFTTNFHMQYISKLSGGEKRRLQLIAVLLKNPNVLILDEPTNDLDIVTMETLEDYLESFKGAVIVISHDRFFLDKVADHLFIFNNGSVEKFNSNVSDYLSIHPMLVEEKVEKVKTVVTNNDIPRFTSKEKKEFDSILDVIDSLENEAKKIEQEMLVNATNYEKLMELEDKKNELKQQIDEKTERWMYLSEINTKIEEYKNNKYNKYK